MQREFSRHRRLARWMLVLLVPFCLSACGEAGTGGPASRDSAEALRVEPAALHLGSLQPRETVEASVRLINTTTRDLYITEAKAGCGCTVIDVPSEALAPGMATDVAIRLRARRHPGDINHTVRFFVDGEDEPTHLSVHATIADDPTLAQSTSPRDDASQDQPTPALNVFPRRLNFGRVAGTERVEFQVIVRDLNEIGRAMPLISTQASTFQVEIVHWEFVEEGIAIDIALTPSAITGRVRDSVDLRIGESVGSFEVYGTIILSGPESPEQLGGVR